MASYTTPHICPPPGRLELLDGSAQPYRPYACLLHCTLPLISSHCHTHAELLPDASHLQTSLLATSCYELHPLHAAGLQTVRACANEEYTVRVHKNEAS